MPTPEFEVTSRDGIIAISGRMDFTTATQILGAVNEHILEIPARNTDNRVPEAHMSDVTQVIDLAGVTHSNSAGLALMIECLAQAQRNGRNIRFENIPDSLRQISTVCQVDSLI